MDYTTLGTVPVSQENPAGDDVKYDEDFERVTSQISKLSSPSGSNTVDWELVAKLCENILEHKSKNLLITVYLSYALLKLRGIEGLSDGVKVLVGILETYWETLYPPIRRIKGRINAVEWLLDNVTKVLEKSDIVEVEPAKKDDFMADLKRVDDFLKAQLEEAPLFYTLTKLADMKLVSKDETLLKEVPSTKEVAVPAAEEVASEETVDAKMPEMSVVPSVVPKTEVLRERTLSGDSEQDFKAAVNDLNLLIGEMIEVQDYRSELFVINRAFAWMDIESLPSSQKSVTLLASPDAQEAELLKKLYKTKDYSTLLWAAESRVTSYLFWLDLHYYVAVSLEKLGFIQASEAVLQQTRNFVKKLPNIQNLTFSDATPFASKETKKWLSKAEISQAPLATAATATQLEQVACDAQGIDRFSYLILHSGSVEKEVLYNIQLCKCLSTTTHDILIKAYTKRLLERVAHYATQRWNPAIALDAYLAAIACLKSLQEEDTEQIAALSEKIALLRPTLAEEI